MPLPMHNVPVCTDRRVLANGTGVESYSRALIAAQGTLDHSSLILVDRIGDAAEGGRVSRLLRGISGRAVRAHRHENILHAHDIFRRAQVHFTLRGRLLDITLPGPPGVMHWTYPLPLRIPGWQNVYTIHDAIPLLHPELTGIDERRHRRLLSAIDDAADALVSVTQAAADEISRAMGWAAGRIFNLSQPVLPEQVDASLPLGLEHDGYLLVCGTIEKRKNVQRIAEAYRQARCALPLIFAGPSAEDEALETSLRTAGAIRLGYVPRAQLVRLIGGARALLMPSLAEGFGLPVIEAMALGTPVLTSCRGALAEVAGGAALTVDPLDVDAIAGAIGRLVEDDTLRKCLAEAGRRRARDFAPQGFAVRLGAFYEELIAGRRSCT